MRSKSIASSAAIGVLAGGLLATPVANADEPQSGEEIVVLFERPMVRSGAPVTTMEGKTATGRPIVQTEIRHRIRFDDLDLATEAGSAALLERVRAVAEEGCAELEKIYAPAAPDPSCARKAVNEATPQVNAAIAEAKAGPGKSTAP
ncbi:MAG: UrcA family protein [Gammaproteobacteria bacterium]|nr:UrcA family protein [Gammaproteobacteria bacterium]